MMNIDSWRTARDEKRFRGADRDGDQKLNREEYADFLHPGKKFINAPQRMLIVYWPEPHTSIHSPSLAGQTLLPKEGGESGLRD